MEAIPISQKEAYKIDMDGSGISMEFCRQNICQVGKIKGKTLLSEVLLSLC
jgi:hypothetical protein